MRVICVSRRGFSVLVFHNVTAIVWSEADNEYGITHYGTGSQVVSVVSNADYFVQIMGFSPALESVTGGSGSSASESSGETASEGSGGSGT